MTHSIRTFRVIGWLLTSRKAIIATAVLLCQAAVVRPEDSVRKEVGRHVKERESLGDKLISVLNDKKEKSAQRLEAATALGEMQYLPAIPPLIRHLTLQDETKQDCPQLEDFPAAPYPCALALTRFGPEVIPPIAKRFVEVEHDSVRDILANVLLRGTPKMYVDESIRYVRGFGYELTERAQLDRLIELYTYLHKGKADKPIIPSEWLKDK